MRKGLLPGNDKEECNTKCENRKDLMKHLEKSPMKRKHTTIMLTSFSFLLRWEGALLRLCTTQRGRSSSTQRGRSSSTQRGGSSSTQRGRSASRCLVSVLYSRPGVVG